MDLQPGFRRAGLKASIDELVDINRELKARGASIEHFYDTDGRRQHQDVQLQSCSPLFNRHLLAASSPLALNRQHPKLSDTSSTKIQFTPIPATSTSPDHAADLFTAATMHGRSATIRTGTPISTWLYRITHNHRQSGRPPQAASSSQSKASISDRWRRHATVNSTNLAKGMAALTHNQQNI